MRLVECGICHKKVDAENTLRSRYDKRYKVCSQCWDIEIFNRIIVKLAIKEKLTFKKYVDKLLRCVNGEPHWLVFDKAYKLKGSTGAKK